MLTSKLASTGWFLTRLIFHLATCMFFERNRNVFYFYFVKQLRSLAMMPIDTCEGSAYMYCVQEVGHPCML